jgi:drug/metabolite transporter (DMT)-like permease
MFSFKPTNVISDFLDNKKKAIILTIIAGVLWGSSFPAIKIGLKYIDAYMFVFLRFLLASIIMFFALLLYKKIDFEFGKKKIIWFLGLINGIAYLLQYVGMGFTTASKSSLLVNLSAVWVAILSSFILKERLGNKKTIGVVFGILGIFLITTNLNFSTLSQGMIWGDLLVLSSGIIWSVFIVYNKKFIKDTENTFQFIAWILFITVLPLIPFVSFSSNPSLNLPVEAWIAIGYTAILCWIVPTYLWLKGLKYISPLTSTIVLLTEPIFAVIISAFLLNEMLTIVSVIGAISILLAIVLVSQNN